MGDRDRTSGFHFLKLAWYSATEDWTSNLIALLLSPILFSLIASGIDLLPIQESEVDQFTFLLWLVFYLSFFTLFIIVDVRVLDPMTPLPISRPDQTLLLLVESLLESVLAALPLAIVILFVAQAETSLYVWLLVVFGLAKAVQGFVLALNGLLDRMWPPQVRSVIETIGLLVGGGLFVGWILIYSTNPSTMNLSTDRLARLLETAESNLLLVFSAVFLCCGISWGAACLAQSLPYRQQRVAGISDRTRSPRPFLLRASDLKNLEPGKAGLWAYLHPWAFILPALVTSVLLLSIPLWATTLFSSSGPGAGAIIIAIIAVVLVTPFVVWMPALVWACRILYFIPFWQVLPVPWKWPAASVGIGLASSVVGFFAAGAAIDGAPLFAAAPERMEALGLLLIPVGTLLISINGDFHRKDEHSSGRTVDFWVCQWPLALFVVAAFLALEVLRSPSLFLLAIGGGFAYNLWAMVWMYRRY